MQKIEVLNLTPDELRNMICESVEAAVRKIKEEEQKPSDWEDISVEKAAQELNCSQRTIRRRMRELNIKGFRVGRHVSLQRKDLKKIKQAS